MRLLLPNKPIKIIPINEFERIICTRHSIDIWNTEGIKTKKLNVNLEHITDAILINETILVASGIGNRISKLIWLDIKANEILKTISSFNKTIASLNYYKQRDCIIVFVYYNIVHIYQASEYSLVKSIEFDFHLTNPIIVHSLNTVIGIDYSNSEYHCIDLTNFKEKQLPTEIKSIEGFNEKYNYIITVGSHTLNIFDLNQQILIHSIKFEGPIYRILVSPDCEAIFVALIYNDAFFYDAKDFNLINQFGHNNNPINTDYEDFFWPVAFNTNSKSVIVGCHSNEVYEKSII